MTDIIEQDGDRVALLCHRCDRPFKSAAIRTLCAACSNNGAVTIPDGAVG